MVIYPLPYQPRMIRLEVSSCPSS
uniref:Acr-2 protein n=1 Tax=Neurospora crassa TaxID=5141 RepID=A2MY42_NEUCS|nr:probable acr-2 regulatory leader protein - Neurospora crassa [Neurospora crassa]BAA08306.1 acr-2 [Neurospora crassa]